MIYQIKTEKIKNEYLSSNNCTWNGIFLSHFVRVEDV